MAPLTVDPAALDGAGSAVISLGDAVAAAISGLALSSGVNTGQDMAGEVFGLAYQDAAEAAFKASATTVNKCRQLGFLMEASAFNYSVAEAASTFGGGAAVLSRPDEPGEISPADAPWTLGAGVPEPALWTVVEIFVGSVWPNGDAAGLHRAAGSWRALGAALNAVKDGLAGPSSVVGAQVMPERELMYRYLSNLGTKTSDIGGQCGKLASELDSFGAAVQQAQDAIRDLLHRLGSVSGLWHEITAIFSGDGLEEIKKVARDIRTVLHQMEREADARRQTIQQVLQEFDTAVVAMQGQVRKGLTSLLGDEVGNPVATAIDTLTNFGEGAIKDVVGIEQSLEQVSQPNLLLNPQRYMNDAKSMLKTGALWYLVNPQEAAEADEKVVKQLLHLDDWRRDRPGLGAGENAVDILSLLISGAGEAGAGVEGAEGAAEAARAAEAADGAGAAGRGLAAAGEVGRATEAMGGIGKASEGATRDLNDIGRGLPKTDPSAAGGRPGGLTPGRPGEPPVRVPTSPVEPKPPPAPATGDAPSSPGKPGENTAAQPSPPAPADSHGPGPSSGDSGTAAAPGEDLPGRNGGMPEPEPGAVAPAGGDPLKAPPGEAAQLVQPAGVPAQAAQPALAAAHAPPPGGLGVRVPQAAMPSAPHTPMPDSSPAGGGRPLEPTSSPPADGAAPSGSPPGPSGNPPSGPLPSPSGGGLPGGRPLEPPPPSDGAPHRPADGEGSNESHSGGGPDNLSNDENAEQSKEKENPTDDDEHYPPGTLPSFGDLRELTKTDPDTAFYWSGRDSSGVGVGPDGSGIAERMAADENGTTLEMTLKKHGLNPLPRWNELDAESVRFWEQASAAYADNASGVVTAIIGSSLRPGNVWESIEIPRLIDNPNVAKIIRIDPDTGETTVIFERP